MSKVHLPRQLSLSIKTHDNEVDLELAQPNQLQSVPSLCGIPLKYLSLVTLAIQNSALTIIIHYSRISTPADKAYSAATAVLMVEILKGFFSMVVALWRVDISGIPADLSQSDMNLRVWLYRIHRLWRETMSPDCWKLSIPAILYVIQNNLQYVAASNLDVATFQVTYQMKILTTAGFSVLLLRKRLLPTQWISLLLLAIGVGVVQVQTGSGASHGLRDGSHIMNPTKGFLAVLSACFTSGLAGVYFEMVLKNSQTDLWVRNLQLSLFSLLPALAPIIFDAHTTNNGEAFSLFQHFGPWAWATVFIQVLGGLITALVIKYSDNILKGFATSLSIVLSFLASVVLFNFEISLAFVLGSSIVLGATWLYNYNPARTPSSQESWISMTYEKLDPHMRSPAPNRVHPANSTSLPTLPVASSSTNSLHPPSDSKNMR